MQIATWNVNSIKVRLQQVLTWLQVTGCDVLALQEIKVENDKFPTGAFNDLGYHVAVNGQKTYNGVAVVSKIPIKDIVYDIPNYQDLQKRVLKVTLEPYDIKVVCTYVVNGEHIDSAKYQYKLEWANKFSNYIANEMNQCDRIIVLGDFNVAPSDLDVYDPNAFDGQVLCSNIERKFFNKLLSFGLVDSFRKLHSSDRQYSWWDYRANGFKRNRGLRIDHILCSKYFNIKACYVDIDTRKHERPSDHAPVVLICHTL